MSQFFWTAVFILLYTHIYVNAIHTRHNSSEQQSSHYYTHIFMLMPSTHVTILLNDHCLLSFQVMQDTDWLHIVVIVPV